MIFDSIATNDALGCYLAHSQLTSDGRIAKGTCLDAGLIRQLLDNEISNVLVARLEAGDVHENTAASRIANSLASTGIRASTARTGRVNLHATITGLCGFDAQSIVTANGIDEGITIATLKENQWVKAGRMVATVKIIPYAVNSAHIDTAIAQLVDHPMCVHQPQPHTADLIQTRLPALKESVLDKTRVITEHRLQQRSVQISSEVRCEHTVAALTNCIRDAQQGSADWLLIAGASAISDRHDVIPQAIVAAGGAIERYGIPVDPGNLLLLARIGNTRVIGLPGCARSPRYNGLDQLLDRMACKIPMPNRWLNSLAIGGLLTEIADRPTPRVATAAKPLIGGLILAGGSSSRAGEQNKLLYNYQQKPLLSHVAERLKASSVQRIVAVTGHEHEVIAAILEDPGIELMHNAAYMNGMAGSLSTGISALVDTDAIVVCLGDMPLVTTDVIERLIDAFVSTPEKSLFIPSYQGKRGNPVLLSKLFFDTLLALDGDRGAKFLSQQYPEKTQEVPVSCAGILKDFDTLEELHSLEH